MMPFSVVTGRLAPLDRANVDTDQIIPKQFLKRIERTGYGRFLFHDWRRAGDFVLDRPEHRGAPILVAGANFGCGSSREHAAWALEDAGYRVVVAPSFGDIFYANCLQVGVLPVRLAGSRVRALIALAAERPASEATVDLESRTLTAPGLIARFEIDAFSRRCLLNGWDAVALALRHEEAIAAYEARRPTWMPRA
ncbi:MAG: 3-isopropylmalate dehydratase small subunit [Candidatus Limnocylindria bacterium]